MELPMKPIEQMPPMATLDLTARLPDGDMALPLGLQAIAFFFEGFTGLAVTIGAILTLFVVMQMTGHIRWQDKFGANPAKRPMPA